MRRRQTSLVGVETASASSAPAPRLRHLLLVGVLGLAAAWVYPRGQAAWELHNRSTKKADHALCMVGPTGPTLLREDPGKLSELLRRRVLTSPPEERPFAACVGLAGELEMAHQSFRAHQARASDFVEYRAGPGTPGSFSVRDIEIETHDLRALTQRAWPFVRGGYLRLVAPSRHAKEAVHPAMPPRPGVGRGLPRGRFHYRSTLVRGDQIVGAFGSGANAVTLVSGDAGLTWRPGGRTEASELLDRCVVDDEGRAFSLSLTESGRQVVLSQGPGAPPQAAMLSEAEERLVSLSCDDSALVAVLAGAETAEGWVPATVRLCPFRRPCRDLLVPELGEGLYFPVDAVRVSGDTVVARSYAGVTRATSSRDDGRSWAPWVVAFDAESSQLPESAAPVRLLKVGERVILAGVPSSERAPYVQLASDDHGASFHAPTP